MSSPAPLILVVGMHRSGTSLLGQLLQALGVALPGELIAADQHNPAGYCERHDVTALQEQLLITLGRWWPGPAGMLPLPEGWLAGSAGRRAAGRLLPLLESEREQQYGPWAIKDPRTSLLLPLWRAASQELGIPLRLVLAVRDPHEVVRSLVQRDGNPAAMTPQRAARLWWHHHQQLLADADNLPLLVVHYSDWFHPRHALHQLKALARFCGAPAASSQALSQIRPEYRRSRSRWGRPRLKRPYRLLAQRLRQLARRGQPLAAADRACLLPGAPVQAPLPQLPPRFRLEAFGAHDRHWWLHTWLDRCPAAPTGFELSDAAEATVGLHLQAVATSAAHGQVKRLRQLALVWDPDPGRVQQLQALGVQAHLVPASATDNGWLAAVSPAKVSSQLGLPDPVTLAAGLPPGRALLCLGTGGTSWEHQLPADLPNLPRFDQLLVESGEQARCLASWLGACRQAGLQLVRLEPRPEELAAMAWRALGAPCHPAPITPAELLADPPPQQASNAIPLISSPPVRTIFERHSDGAEPAAAITISLHNYADRINTALASAHSQSLTELELVVVDDASSDASAAVALAWLQRHGVRFRRCLLLQHHHNGGLAAARNTGFAACQAPWVFVLDADNALEPACVERCLAMARAAPAATAVVHPLVALHCEGLVPGQTDTPLLEGRAWQRGQFRHGNAVDAMALVRRQAWHQVGGYSHIPDGWEDYDFWCKLIEAGHHGVLCPQRLATYHRHDASMQATTTVAAQPRVRRLLNARHAWLQLDPDHLA